MADPLSILTGTIALVESAVKLEKFIDETKKGIDNVDKELLELKKEIEDLESISNLIHNAFKNDLKDVNTTQDDPAAKSWSAVSSTLEDCNNVLASMAAVFVKVMGKSGSLRRDRVRRYFRKLSSDPEMSDLRHRLGKGHDKLHLLFNALNM